MAGVGRVVSTYYDFGRGRASEGKWLKGEIRSICHYFDIAPAQVTLVSVTEAGEKPRSQNESVVRMKQMDILEEEERAMSEEEREEKRQDMIAKINEWLAKGGHEEDCPFADRR